MNTWSYSVINISAWISRPVGLGEASEEFGVRTEVGKFCEGGAIDRAARQ